LTVHKYSKTIQPQRQERSDNAKNESLN